MIWNIVLFLQSSHSTPYRYLGKFNIKRPAFLQPVTFHNSSQQHLLISQFAPLGQGHVYLASNITAKIKSNKISQIKPVQIGRGFKWPNKLSLIPESVFNSKAVLVPDGFLVPTHKTGGIYAILLDTSNNPIKTIKLTQDKEGYFYHMGEWIDLNGDGQLDLLTARSNAQKGGGEMLWLEKVKDHWIQHIVVSGPDIIINPQQLDGDPNTLQIISGEFFNQLLTMTKISAKTGRLIERIIIDDEIRHAYNPIVLNLNGDGKLHIVVGNHQTHAQDNGIYAYEIPLQNVMNKSLYIKRTLAQHFPVVKGPTNMAPGFVTPVWPKLANINQTCVDLLVAGDGDYLAHWLQCKDRFVYENNIIENEKGTVGIIVTQDFTGDGFSEFMVANYDRGFVQVYTFAPQYQKEYD